MQVNLTLHLKIILEYNSVFYKVIKFGYSVTEFTKSMLYG